MGYGQSSTGCANDYVVTSGANLLVAADIVKPKHEQRQPGKRKRGGQRGHFGYTRELLAREELDGINESELTTCPDCGTGLNPKRVDEVKRNQIAELVERPVEQPGIAAR